MKNKSDFSLTPAGLRHRAEARLSEQGMELEARAKLPKSAADARRMFHELQVHQVELELQNAELRQARDNLEVALENYTDLYDFAPVGYFTLAENGIIQFVNLTGASLSGALLDGSILCETILVGAKLMMLVAAAQRRLP